MSCNRSNNYSTETQFKNRARVDLVHVVVGRRAAEGGGRFRLSLLGVWCLVLPALDVCFNLERLAAKKISVFCMQRLEIGGKI